MNSFIDGTEGKPTSKPVVYIHSPRKDGRIPVTYCFTARQIKKLHSAEQVETLKADTFYSVRFVR